MKTSKLKILHIVTACSIALYVIPGLLFCGIGDECGGAGLILAPLSIPAFILVPYTVVVDMVVLARRLAPRQKRLVSAAVLTAVFVGLAVAYVIFDHHQYYSLDKTVNLIQDCKVEAVNYREGEDIYFYPFQPINGKDQLKVHGSDRTRIIQALKNSASACKYELETSSDRFSADSY